MGRSPCCDKTKVKKGPWSVEEDALLTNFVLRYGNGGNWISLPKKVGLNRCGKSCRLRWLNYLRPDIKHGHFTEEEDYMIYTLYNTVGSRWSVIASHLPGRTDNDVKNYWNTKLKRKISSGKFKNISINNTTNYNYSGISSNDIKTEYCTQNLQTLGHGTNMSSELDRHHFLFDQGQGDIFNMVKIEEQDIQSLSCSNSVTPDISSYSGSSSSLDSTQISCDSTTFLVVEDEFWMDLLSDSFEDVGVGSELEEKISEIASLLDS